MSRLLRAVSEETDEDVRRVLTSCLFSLGSGDYEAEAKETLSDLLGRDSPDREHALISECIAQILRAGERSVLERVIETAIHKDRPELLFALAASVQGFPLRELLSDMGSLSFVEDEEEANEILLSWWQAHRKKLTWDVARRRFLVGP